MELGLIEIPGQYNGKHASRELCPLSLQLRKLFDLYMVSTYFKTVRKLSIILRVYLESGI